MKVTCLFIALFGLGLIVGCSETPSGPSTSSVIMPLAVGNQWVSELTSFDNNGNPIISLDTFKIESKVFENGKEVFYSSRNDPYYYLNNTLYTMVDSLPWFIVQPPKYVSEVVRNDTFVIAETDSYGDPTGETYTLFLRQWVKAMDTMITVKAGTFKCFAYNSTLITPKFGFYQSERSFFSEGVGSIKSESYSDTLGLLENLTYSWQLVSYHLN